MTKSISLIFFLLLSCGSLSADKQARLIKYSPKDIAELKCKVRFSTTIVLPASEQILDFTTGDKDLWVINGAQNFCYVHPTTPDTSTNLNLICASGNVYSFLLAEVTSHKGDAEVDYKVIIEPRELDQSHSAIFQDPHFVRLEEVQEYKRQIQDLQSQMEASRTEAKQASEREISQYKSKYPTSLVFQYRFKSMTPFVVSTIFHDESFTYIYCQSAEKPAIYEIRDGKPNLINFQVENGCYIIPKVLDRGYLQVGKKRMDFWRQGA